MADSMDAPNLATQTGGLRPVCHRPLIPIVIALAIGVFIGGTRPGYSSWAFVAAVPALVGVGVAWHRRCPSIGSPLLLIGLLGYLSISPWLPSVYPAKHISHYMDSDRWEITGILAEMLPPSHGRTRLALAVTQIRDGRRTHRVFGRIRVTVTGECAGLLPGMQLGLNSRIRSFRNFGNPGGFDYRRYMAFQRLSGSAFVGADGLRVLAACPTKTAESIIDRYRHRARSTIERLDDPDARAIMQAILIGDRRAVPSDLRRVFNRCGVGHLLAISGLHVGIVSGLVYGVFLWLLHRCPLVLDRGWGRRGATLLAVGPVLFYAILSGMSPATQRALVMVLAFMATFFVFRGGDTLNFLALAALLMLVWNPPVLFSISFQMSFAAVFWIVLGLSRTAPTGVSEKEQRSGWRQRLVLFLLVTCWATAGTLPLTMAYFQEVSLIGMAANCFMVPLTGLFVLPIGLGALFVLPMHEGLAGVGLEVAGWGLSQGIGVLRAVSGWDGAALQTFIPTPWEVAGYYLLLGAIVAWPTRKPLRLLWLVLFAALLGDGLYWGYQRYWHGDLRITVLDVGQGSAALAEFPGGHTMLIDGGGATNNDYFDVGARVVAPFLRSRKILQVDTVILSHPSSDHMNGLVYILRHFEPQQLLWTGDRASTQSFRLFMQEVENSNVAVPAWTTVERRWAIGDVEVRIINPPVEDVHTAGFSEGDYNNRSIAVKLIMGRCAILFPGDIQAPAEAALIACCRSDLSSNVLVAPHHGSLSSSTVPFLSAVAPETVVISAGWMNRFGFPHPSVLRRYRERVRRIYRTDRHGAIVLQTDGRRWRAKPHMD